MPDNLTMHGHDLACGAPPALAAMVRQPTLVIAEGVLMYLPPRAACRLLHALAGSAGCDELMASFALPRRDGRLAFARRACRHAAVLPP